MEYESIIGLEIHVQLATNSKMFCQCANEFTTKPNFNVCPVCLGLPGALPSINIRAVKNAVKLGLATNCNISRQSVFARKNYFYPDLPKSYQISQFETPICEKGWADISLDGKNKRIGITRIHMEEDAGKLIHDGLDYQLSYVDLNRAGVPLLEIVSEPDIRSAVEAKKYMEKIYSLVTYLDICHGDMEKGNFRCDANISIRKKGDESFGTRTEIKNLNSFRFVQQAIEFEINRQIDATIDGEPIVQETRLFDSSLKKTFSMRLKEDSQDYRYFPCPDLPVVLLNENLINNIENDLPELPDTKKNRFVEQYKLSNYEADILVTNKHLANYFEEAVKFDVSPKKVVNWLLSDFLKMLNETSISIEQSKVTPLYLVNLIQLINNETISSKIAKQVFITMFNDGANPNEIVKKQGLAQISDEKLLTEMIEQLLSEHPKEVKVYKSGRDRVLGFFVGRIMSKTKGKANPKLVNTILIKLIKNISI